MVSFEDHMVRVAVYIEQEGGMVSAEPGQLIREMAEAIFGVEIRVPAYRHPEYHIVSQALIALEETGIVAIERVGANRPERANKLTRVWLVD